MEYRDMVMIHSDFDRIIRAGLHLVDAQNKGIFDEFMEHFNIIELFRDIRIKYVTFGFGANFDNKK